MGKETWGTQAVSSLGFPDLSERGIFLGGSSPVSSRVVLRVAMSGSRGCVCSRCCL